MHFFFKFLVVQRKKILTSRECRFAVKLGVDSKLEGWGDEELTGLNMEAAAALGIPNPLAARLVSFIRWLLKELAAAERDKEQWI